MKPEVSIICITYNHGEYVEETLKGFVSQKTTFPFEIIIHDDASTDNTVEVIKRYAEMYPDIIVPIFEKENQYSKGNPIIRPMMTEYAQGKYMAICEGDDYWCDSRKLQIQYDYMQSNSECSLYLHNGNFLNQKTGKLKRMNPYPVSMMLEDTDVIKESKVMPPTASMFFRSKDILEMPDLFWDAPVGDRPRRLYLITKGYVYYSDRAMCVYRINTTDSFSARVSFNETQREKVLNGMLILYKAFNEYTNFKYSDEVDYITSREYYDFYIRKGDKRLAMKTRYYKETASFLKKLKWKIWLLIAKRC